MDISRLWGACADSDGPLRMAGGTATQNGYPGLPRHCGPIGICTGGGRRIVRRAHLDYSNPRKGGHAALESGESGLPYRLT